jgi:ABC-type uncharacterized transport system substrate-binding protein
MCIALMMGIPTPAQAHPHAWIDIQTTAIINEKNELVALRHHWTFDRYYSEFILYEYLPEEGKKPTPEILLSIAKQSLKNLQAYGYFTVLTQTGKHATFSLPTHISNRLEQQQLVMEFTLPLTHPIALENNTVQYRVFDPSYYVEMLHKKPNDAKIENTGTLACTSTIAQANPTIEQTTLAASLDKSATAPEGLGGVFAQTVTVACP